MTTLQLRELKRLNKEGVSGLEISRRLGVPSCTVYKWLHRLGLPTPSQKETGPGHTAIYAVYNHKDELLACGTSDECAKAMGCRVQTIYRGAMKTRKGEGKFRFYYRIDGEGEDD